MVANAQDGFRRMDDAQSDWLLGMQSAIKEFMDAQQNVAA